MPRPAKPSSRPPNNPIRDRKELRAPTPTFNRPPTKPAPRAKKRACPNEECTEPNIVEGICHSCGTVVDDSNIVSEIAFVEDGRGGNAAVGTKLGDGQGVANTLAPGMRRMPGANAGSSSSRDGTIQEGQNFMNTFNLRLPGIASRAMIEGIQIFKMAATSNFIQGRRIDMVAAVCLYSACRKNKPCKVMLIDFAEIIKVNVYKLGHTFKTLHRVITFSKEEWAAVLPEDLMYRFAMKLEFGDETPNVANTAIKLARQMSIDWMAMGRRPAGVCGACIIVAARMHNFRRTVTEVVYIVKVATATLNKRLDEFKITPSAAMSVAEFMNYVPDPSAAAYDPPSFYEKSEEFIKNKKTRKRKRKAEQLIEDEDEDDQESEEADPDKRLETTVTDSDEIAPTVELRRDADGFVIPAQPSRPEPESQDISDLIDDTTENPTTTALQNLASRFLAVDGENTTSTPKRNQPRAPDVVVPDALIAEEDEIENEIASLISETLANPKMAELISDPNASEHTRLYLMAEKKVQQHMAKLEKAKDPSKQVSGDTELLEDEFANDPEVQNCLLSPEDVARKEKLWVNENKGWLRQQQIKEYEKRIAANGPPKKRRNRKKMIRIGEGQTSPAASAGEAAVNAIKERALSKKINYNAIEKIFEGVRGPGGRSLGSATTSRATSRTGSSVSGTEDEGSQRSESEGLEDDYVRPNDPSDTAKGKQPADPHDSSDEDDSEEDEPEVEAESTWKNQGNRGIDEGGEGEQQDEEFGEDDNDYGDMNEIDVFGED